MKNHLCLIIFCALHFCLCGQEAEEKVRNNKIIGGIFSFSYVTEQELSPVFNPSTGSVTDEVIGIRNLNFSSNPYIGFPLSKTSFIGLSPQISWLRTNVSTELAINSLFVPMSNITIGINLFYRKNIISSKKARLFLQPFTGISNSRDLSNENIFSSEGGDNNLMISAGIGLGGLLNLSPKWSLVAHIWDGDYTYNSSKNMNEDFSFLSVSNNHVVDLSFSFSTIRFGIERSF